ncbi:MAG: thioredoxin family protein [Flavobacteriales bacterium]|nr:thioredoxin family protein [Flavobacteriales bacterium]
MKFNILIVTLLSCTLAFTPSSESSNLKIGSKAPKTDLALKDVSGKQLNLEKIAQDNGLLVIFSCNTCPFVIGNGSKSEGWENRYNELAKMAKELQVGSVLVNSNEAKRTKGDSFEDMVERAKEKAFISHYVLDQDHVLADAFGAKTTPHVFLFNSDMELVYQGAIDDNVDRRKEVDAAYLKTAMTAMVRGEKIKVQETKPIGCSIKRVAAK